MAKPHMTEPVQAATAIGISLVFVILSIVAAFTAITWYFTHQPLPRSPQAPGITIMASLVSALASTAFSFFVYRIALRMLKRIAGCSPQA